MAGLLAFVPLYARDLGLPNSSLVLFGFAGIIVVIRSLGARLPDRLGTARATIWSLAGVTLGLTVIGLWRTPAGLIFGTVVLAVGVALATPSIMALAWEAAPAAERGAATSTVAMAIDVALGFGPAAFGLVAVQTSRPGAYLAAAVVAGLGLALALRSARSRPS
jgi:MFS family permease